MTNAIADRRAHQRLSMPFSLVESTPASVSLDLAPLTALVGRWITEGETISSAGARPLRLLASHVYRWAPGGHFLVHDAHGRIGDVEFGGVEIISADRSSGQFRTQLYDSDGGVSTQSLTHRNGIWTWGGTRERCVAVLGDGGKTLMAKHECSADGITWMPSMQAIHWKAADGS